MDKEDLCPFCGAEPDLRKTCPTCKHTEGYLYGDKWECETVVEEGTVDYFRSYRCYETELAALRQQLAESKKLLEYVLKPKFYAKCRTERDKPIQAFLNRPEVKKSGDEL